MDQRDLEARRDFAVDLCRKAGDAAKTYFRNRDTLVIDQKGAQDWVSEADKNVETLIRDCLSETFPDDGVVGEEHGASAGASGFTWVIDPIDGTTNFVNGIPAFTIVLAGVFDGQTQLGVIHDPMNDETFAAVTSGGAVLNNVPMHVAEGTPIGGGTIAVGYSNRVEASNVIPVVAAVVAEGAMFHRNASGALSLAYVAAGRLLGYIEEHMNAWDCLAGQLLVAEAGGRIELQDADAMIRDGGRVIAGTDAVFDKLVAIADSAWGTG